MRIPAIPRSWSRVWLAAWALCLGAAPAPSWRSETVKKLFSCEVPASWRMTRLAGEKTGVAYSDGLARLSAVRHAGVGARFAGPQAFIAETENLGGPLTKLGRVAVAGQDCARYKRLRQPRPRDDGGNSEESVYEEFVLRQDPKGFWLLTFSSSARDTGAAPRGLEAWTRFLKSFQPL